MLTEWSIGNFKSFSGNTTLPLAPITILAGSNSSGKSSIIQSILLIKQTLQYAPVTRPIGLNGPLLKLGRFDDIKNTTNPSPDISIGWVLDELQSYRFSPGGIPSRYMYYPGADNPLRATYSLSFGVNKSVAKRGNRDNPGAELLQLQPTLTALSLKVDIDEEKGPRSASVNLAKKNLNSTDADTSLDKYDLHFPYTAKRIDPLTRDSITGRRPENSLIGADLRHFFPFRFGFYYNQRKYFSQKVSEYLVTPNANLRFVEPEITEYVLPSEVISLLVDHVGEFKPIDGDATRFVPRAPRLSDAMAGWKSRRWTAKEFARSLDDLFRHSSRARQALRHSLIERQEDVQHLIFELGSNLSEKGFQSGVSHDFSAAAEHIQNFFQTGIYYLGPLRDEPRPIYPLEALINPKDVGYRGEHTAAVLDLHRETLVECFKSSDASMLIGAKKAKLPLQQAVQDWLSYLGVAEAVSTTDLGKIGHQLQVSVDQNGKSHDLTNVGVGVSQLLPIVVMSLLANTPSLLVFEQPELHLHPKVQARLADFFFSLSLLGKQCLLETHSEYLVERFRLRIAQAPGEALNEKVKIYFTQKIEGKTVCSEVRLSKYGAVLDWPDDFFDQSESETEAILRAAQKKKNSEKTASTRDEA